MKPKSQIVRLRLVIDVDYELPPGSVDEHRSHVQEMVEQLQPIPPRLAGEGLLSGESEVTVDAWTYDVSVISSSP